MERHTLLTGRARAWFGACLALSLTAAACGSNTSFTEQTQTPGSADTPAAEPGSPEAPEESQDLAAEDGARLGAGDVLPFTTVFTGDRDPDFARCLARHAAPLTDADIAILTQPAPEDAYPPEHFASRFGEASEDARLAVFEAADRCLPVALLVVRVDDEDGLRTARCVLDLPGDATRWADVATLETNFAANRDAVFEMLPLGVEACGEIPHAGTLTEDDPRAETASTWRDLWQTAGVDVSQNVVDCFVVEADGAVDLDADLEDLEDTDLQVLGAALEVCFPLAGVLAESLDLSAITGLCLLGDPRVAEGWTRTLEIAGDVSSLQEEEARNELRAFVEPPLQECLGTPGTAQVIAELGEDWDAEVVLATADGVWVGGWGDGGDNLLLLDAATGAVLESYATNGSIDSITVDADAVWVGTDFRLQRVVRGTGEIDVMVDADGRDFGRILLAGGRLWVSDAEAGSLLALDAATGTILTETVIFPDGWFAGRTDLLVHGDFLWFGHDGEATISRIDLSSGELFDEIVVDDEFTYRLSAAGGAVIATSGSEFVVIEDAEVTATLDRRDVEGRIGFTAGGGDLVWFTNDDSAIISLFDPDALMVVERHLPPASVGGELEAPFSANAVAAFGVSYGGQVFRIDRASA